MVCICAERDIHAVAVSQGTSEVDLKQSQNAAPNKVDLNQLFFPSYIHFEYIQFNRDRIFVPIHELM